MLCLSHNVDYSCYNWAKHLSLCSLVATGKREILLVTYILPFLCGKKNHPSISGTKLSFY